MSRHLLILVVATVVVFSNSLGNAMHLDDLFRVRDNPGVERFWPPTRHITDPTTMATVPRLQQYRPLLPLTLSINHAIAGHSLVGYHIGNLLLQVLASIAVYFFLLELLTHWVSLPGSGPGSGEATGPGFPPAWAANTALFAALAFAIHPVGGILVNYISGRDLVMMQGFLILAFWLYIRMRRIGVSNARWGGVLTCFVLALLSKKNAVVMPALVLVFELLFAKDSIRDRLMRTVPFVILVVTLFAFIAWGLQFEEFGNVVKEGGPASDRIARSAHYSGEQMQHHLFHYLRNVVWPFPIRQLPVDAVTVVGQVLGGLAIAGTWFLAYRYRRRMPIVSFCVLAYTILLLPTSSVMPLHASIVAYRPYPSSVFLFLLAAFFLARWGARGAMVGVGLLVYFGVSSFFLNRDWRDGETLYRHSLAYGASASAHISLAQRLRQPDPAEKRRLLEKALEMEPRSIEAIIGLGLLLIEQGEKAKGLDLVNRGVAEDPDRADSYDWQTRAYLQCQDLPNAARAAARAATLDPGNPRFACVAGVLTYETGDPAAAVRFLLPLVQGPPHPEFTPRAHTYLAKCYEKLGDPARARLHRQRAR